MTYLTLLVFMAAIDGEDFHSPIPFNSEQKCEQALRAADELYEIFHAEWGNTMARCVKTDVATGYTMRPRNASAAITSSRRVRFST